MSAFDPVAPQVSDPTQLPAPQQWAPQGMAHQLPDPRHLHDPQMPTFVLAAPQLFEPPQMSGPCLPGCQEFEPQQIESQQWMAQAMAAQGMIPQAVAGQLLDPRQLSDPQMLASCLVTPQCFEPTQVSNPYPTGSQGFEPQQLMPQDMVPQNMVPHQWMPHQMIPQDMAHQLPDPRQLSYPQLEMPAYFPAAPQSFEPTQQSGPLPSGYQELESQQSAPQGWIPQDWVAHHMIPQDMAHQDMAGQISGPPQLLPSSQFCGPLMPDVLPSAPEPSAPAQLSAPDTSGSQGFESHEWPPQVTSGQLSDSHQLPSSSKLSPPEIPDTLPCAPEPSAPSTYSASERDALQAFASYALATQAPAVASSVPEQSGPNQSGQETSTIHQYAPQASAVLQSAPPQISQSLQPSYDQPPVPQSGFIGPPIALGQSQRTSTMPTSSVNPETAPHQPGIRADLNTAPVTATASVPTAERHESVNPPSNQFGHGHTQINPRPSYQQTAPPAPAPAPPASPVVDDDDDDDNNLILAHRKARKQINALKVGPMEWMPAKEAYDTNKALKELRKEQKLSKKRLITRKDPLGEITAHMELEKTKNLNGFIGGEWAGRAEGICRWIDKRMQGEVQRKCDQYLRIVFPVPDPKDPRLVPRSEFVTNRPAPAAPVVNNHTAAAAAPGGANGAVIANDDGPQLPRGWAVGEEEDDDSSTPSSATTTQESSTQAANSVAGTTTTSPSVTAGANEAVQPQSSIQAAAAPTDPTSTGISQMMSNMSIGKRGRDEDDNAGDDEMAKCHRTAQSQDVGSVATPRRPEMPVSAFRSLAI